jgi:predicted dehydrogenase
MTATHGAPLAIAVVGAGLIGRRHARVIQSLAGARLHCIIDPDPSAREFARSISAAWQPSLESALAQDPPRGAIIATPNSMHVEQALACVAAGIPALVEKPLAADAASARILVEAGERAGVPLAVGHHRRHNPLIAAAKTLIAQGALGRIVAVNGMFWTMKPDDYFDVRWRREAGGGPLFINLVHDIDLMRHLVGEVDEVLACTSSVVRGFEVEDGAAVVLRFANGALGTFSVSDTVCAPWSWELTAAENPAYPASGQSCYHIGGTHGSLEIPAMRLWRHEGERNWWRPISATTYPAEAKGASTGGTDGPQGDPLVLQAAQFIRVVAGEEEPLVPAREGLRTLETIEAIKRAVAANGSCGAEAKRLDGLPA